MRFLRGMFLFCVLGGSILGGGIGILVGLCSGIQTTTKPPGTVLLEKKKGSGTWREVTPAGVGTFFAYTAIGAVIGFLGGAMVAIDLEKRWRKSIKELEMTSKNKEKDRAQKPCPYCGKALNLYAVKCKYCKGDL